MKQLTENEFSLRVVSESTETEIAKCVITIGTTESAAVIEGECCEACFQYQGFYLVLTTNNCPYEESLNIHYLNQKLELLDKATLSWPYNTGSFSLVGLTEPNKLLFKFFNDETWTLEAYTKKQFLIPALSEPRGVWRKFGFYYYFKIYK